MRKLLPVEGEQSIVRDPSTSAILTVDRSALIRHRRLRESILSKDQQINNLNERLSNLENMIQTI